MNKNSKQEKDYEFFSKTIFLPKQGILAIGDLHLGYESMLKNQGVMFPFNQLENTKKELKNIIKTISKKNFQLKKIILLGDIRHHFSFDKYESFEVSDFLSFLKKFVEEKNLILIRGNHDIIKIKNKKYRNYYINLKSGLAFIHGDRFFKEILDKRIKTIVMGHVHPAVLIRDLQGIKKEKFKAFLIGKWKGKKLIIVPSFFPLIEGMEINEFYGFKSLMKNKPIISNRDLRDFEVYVLGKDKVYFFGKFKEL